MNHGDFLDAASRIGDRLARQAIWYDSACTWKIRAPDRSRQGHSVTQHAAGLLYQGTSGIAWFLAELARATVDTKLARVAEGGLQQALEAGAEIAPASFGFYSGRVGIAWVAARVARILEKHEYLEKAWELLDPLTNKEFNDTRLDVIGGAAGAIPALLELAFAVEREEPLKIAWRLGENLILRTHHEPVGWSWPTVPMSAVRNLNGLAHGAAGFGLALLELARATGESRFRFAAEMTFLYERHFYNPWVSNWPDLRNNELGKFILWEDDRDKLVDRALKGTLPTYQPSYMTAWCHGSPGIGLSRLRAFELTGQEIYRREAEAAVRSTLESVADSRLAQDNFSLCHGLSGNCDMLLTAAARLGEPAWHKRVLEVAQYGWETYEKAGRSWPCGTIGRASDPSLLLGEAGIGMFYLRLAKPDTPSVLLLRPEHRTTDPLRKATAEDFSALARESADEFFAVSRRAVERLTGSSFWTPQQANGKPLSETPAESLHTAIRRLIETTTDNKLRALLDDAVLADLERWDATRTLDDFTTEFVRDLTHSPWDDLDPQKTFFQRALDSRLLETCRDWARWPEEEPGAALPPKEEVHLLLYRKDNRIHSRRVEVFTALLLDALEKPLTLNGLVDRVASSLDGRIKLDLLATKIQPQLEELYRAGFVERCQTHPKQLAVGE